MYQEGLAGNICTTLLACGGLGQFPIPVALHSPASLDHTLSIKEKELVCFSLRDRHNVHSGAVNPYSVAGGIVQTFDGSHHFSVRDVPILIAFFHPYSTLSDAYSVPHGFALKAHSVEPCNVDVIKFHLYFSPSGVRPKAYRTAAAFSKVKVICQSRSFEP